MVPRSITSGLSALRRRERLLQLAWGLARWSALAVGLLLAGATLDWLIDRDQDTPWGIRIGIFTIQVVILGVAAWFWLLRPLLRSLPNYEVALWVESKNPHLQERLISAVQLNQAGADTEGMSPALIAQVTREAENQSKEIAFAGLADHRRLRWSAALAGPALLVIALPFLLWPGLAGALLSRQLLTDRDIPRSIALETITAEVFPQGEKVLLRFRAGGKNLTAARVGEVRVKPDGQPQDRYELRLDEKAPRADGAAAFVAQLPASSTDFTYRAWLGDGRSRPARVRFVPPPVVIEQHAWVQLPTFCGLRPSGLRYEQPQPRGDLVGIAGSAGRVVIKAQKPVRKATLILVQQKITSADLAIKEERLLEHLPMRLDESGTQAEAIFDLKPEANLYEIELVDEYGFVNKPRPRRGLRIVPEEPPQVALLKEQFPPKLIELLSNGDRLDDAVVEGIPVLYGGKIRIPFQGAGPYGLGQARILYRVLKKTESGNDPEQEAPWTVLPLGEVKAGPMTGPFDLRTGAFANSPFLESIPFHAMPSPEPELLMGRLQGGGRYDLDTNGLVDAKGNPLPVKLGDQIEYCVEIFADQNADPKRPSARSETRVKSVVSLLELTRWMEETTREEQAIKNLDKKQRGVFEK